MRVHKEMLARWEKFCDLYIRELGYGQSTKDVKSSSCAWTIANRLDIPKEAYHVGLHDAHITTALRRIFPNAGL